MRRGDPTPPDAWGLEQQPQWPEPGSCPPAGLLPSPPPRTRRSPQLSSPCPTSPHFQGDDDGSGRRGRQSARSGPHRSPAGAASSPPATARLAIAGLLRTAPALRPRPRSAPGTRRQAARARPLQGARQRRSGRSLSSYWGETGGRPWGWGLCPCPCPCAMCVWEWSHVH